MAKLKNPIEEAKRYMENAKQILSEKAGKDGDLYTDPKYVKMAGNTAWNGVLVALDGALGVRNNLKKGQRVYLENYIDAVYKKDKKMSSYLLAAYDSLHKSLGYDGILGYKSVQAAMEYGQKMIVWAARYCPKDAVS